jgi:hypothetical protein
MADTTATPATTTAPEAAAPPPAAGDAPPPAGADTAPAGPSPLRRAVLTILLILVGVGLLFLIIDFDPLRHWFALHTGTLNGGPDKYYNFWSGFGSDLGEATLISAVGIGVYTGVRKVNCHTKGCWRIGHHKLDGTPYILCRHHHPDVPTQGASHEHILEQHHRAKARTAKDHAELVQAAGGTTPPPAG